jgi:putative phage-type endonuclease
VKTVTGQEIHPDAVLLGDPEPNTLAWYRIRRMGITATDLPKILGLSSYGNARSVWHDKRGELSGDDLSEAGQWGHLLEDVVAQEWARRTDNTVSRIGILSRRDAAWKLASCDRLIDGKNAALEVKTRSAYVAGRWRDDIPDDVLAQVAWQRLVGGFDYVEVACLIGGQQLTTHRYEQDAALEEYLCERALEVWEMVQSGHPPIVDMDGVLLRLLDQLYPDRTGIATVTHTDAVALLMDYASAQSMAKLADQAKEASKARIVSALGEAEVLELEGGTDPLFTYRNQDKHTLNLRDLEDNDAELYEQVLAGGHITTTSSRVLRAGKGAKGVST